MRNGQDMAITVLDRYDVRQRQKRRPCQFRASRSTSVFIWISLARIDLKPVRNSSARFGRILARRNGALNARCTLLMLFCTSCISSFKTLFSVVGHIMLGFERICVIMGVVRDPASYPMGTRDSFPGLKRRGVKLSTHLHLVPRSRMRGAVLPLLNTSSWHGAYISTGTTLPLPLPSGGTRDRMDWGW
jgi:hypothetical protein